MKVILAISGGVDSMVLLERWRKKYSTDDFAVATFDHGTRASAKADAEFVEKCCKNYNIRCLRGEGRLGSGASEAEARRARYEFLGKVRGEMAREWGVEEGEVKIVTAQHLDDLVESVAINLARGTEWRGLGVMGRRGVERPLIDWTKKEILKYASERGVVFREDPTNSEEKYLRNRLRGKVRTLGEEEKRKIGELARRQREIAEEVEEIIREMIGEREEYPREWFDSLPEELAEEVARYILEKNGVRTTRPQRRDFVEAVRTYAPGKRFNLPQDKMAKIGRDKFEIVG